MNSRVMSIIIVSSVVVVLITYGLFASFYWPVTAVSPDVWGEGYAQLQPTNIAATATAVILWAVVCIVAAWVAIRLGRRAAPPHGTAIALTLLGAATVLLSIPVALASVAVYNVVPTTTAYPDFVTPFVLGAGVISLLVGAIISAFSAARMRRLSHTTDTTTATTD